MNNATKNISISAFLVSYEIVEIVAVGGHSPYVVVLVWPTLENLQIVADCELGGYKILPQPSPYHIVTSQ